MQIYSQGVNRSHGVAIRARCWTFEIQAGRVVIALLAYTNVCRYLLHSSEQVRRTLEHVHTCTKLFWEDQEKDTLARAHFSRDVKFHARARTVNAKPLHLCFFPKMND